MDVDKMLAQNQTEQQFVGETIKNAMQHQAELTDEERALRQVAKFIKARSVYPNSKVLRGQTMRLRPPDVDLNGTETMEDKLRRMAERAPMRQVNLTETTRLLLSLGVTGHTQQNLRAIIFQCLDRMPDARKIVRGWWQVVPGDRGILNDTYVSLDHPEVGEGAGEEIELPDEELRLKPMKWKTRSVDYSQARNLAERIILLADESEDGFLDPNQMAARLLAGHQSTQRPTSSIRLVGRTREKLPEFREVHRGLFQWSASPRHPADQRSDTSYGESPSRETGSSRSILDPSSGETAIGGRNGSTHR